LDDWHEERHHTSAPIESNFLAQIWKVFFESGLPVNRDTSACQNFLREAFRCKTKQMAGILKPTVRCKVLRVVPMAPCRVRKGIGHNVAFASERKR
jgi:hypothetical protein